MSTGAEILKEWLRNSTCHRHVVKRSLLLENKTHVVLKHNSHAEYCGRGSGTLTCNSYAALYAKGAFDLSNKYCRTTGLGYGEIAKWEGRISLKRIVEECREMGICFNEVE